MIYDTVIRHAKIIDITKTSTNLTDAHVTSSQFNRFSVNLSSLSLCLLLLLPTNRSTASGVSHSLNEEENKMIVSRFVRIYY